MTAHPAYTVETESEQVTVALAEAMARELCAGDVVAIAGELGAGKTRFVRGLAIGLGHDPAQVSSPTFVVMQEYDSPGARLLLVHVDAYRLDGDDDAALGIGWDEAMTGDAVVAIEWPQRIEAMLPKDCFRVLIEHIGATARRLTITCPTRRSLAALSDKLHRP